DGVTVWNGERHRLGPFPHNEPPYLGYALAPRRRPDGLRLQIDRTAPADELESLLIGTDGVAELDPLSPFRADRRIFRNADLARRRLTVLARSPETRLHDDATLVVIRAAT